MREDKFGYEDLEVWQKAIDWASEMVSLIDDLETNRRHFRLIEQLESAAGSVAANIAGGQGKIFAEGICAVFVRRQRLIIRKHNSARNILKAKLDKQRQVCRTQRKGQRSSENVKCPYKCHKERS